MTDAYDDCGAEEILSSAPRPGSPASAAKLLAATGEDLFLLDLRDWDLATLPPLALEWGEE